MLDNLTFSWLNPIIKKVVRRNQVSDYDLGQLDTKFSPQRTSKQLVRAINQSKPSILKASFKAFKKSYIPLILTTPIVSLCTVISPLAVQHFTQFLTPSTFTDCTKLISPNPFYSLIPYKEGIVKGFKNLYVYLILVFISQYLKVLIQGIALSQTSQGAIKINTACLDLLYSKITKLSSSSRSNFSDGNLVNLLYTDTQRISLFFQQISTIAQMPIDIIAYLIYMGVSVTPLAFVGLIAYLLFLPIIAGVMSIVFSTQRRIMAMRDQRMRRVVESLNGIRVIKYFSMEEIMEKRLQNIRKVEIKNLFKMGLCMSVFSLISQSSSPVMTSIAFGTMVYLKQFDVASAFTIMFLFLFLSISIISLPMSITGFQEASISSKRLLAFLQLPERLNYINQTDQQEIKVEGDISFTWSNKADTFMPPILDSFYKENQKKIKRMKRTLPKLELIFQQISNKLQPINAIDYNLLTDNDLDEYSVQFDVPFYSKIKITDYVYPRYDYKYVDENQQGKIMYLHIKVMQKLLNQDNIQVAKQPVLHDISFNIKSGELVGICGVVGSGKSSLLQALIGELRVYDKNEANFEQYIIKPEQNCQKCVQIPKNIAYFAQNAQIFNTSIKQNITFNKPFNQAKYDHIIDICCLKPDLQTFPYGDQTEVGAKGVTISGGQKARIAFARCIYSEADVYLLDDPLSAVDTHVGSRLWNEVIINELVNKGKTVLIVSHQTSWFKECDRIMVLENGRIKKYGTLEELKNSDINIQGLTDGLAKINSLNNHVVAQQMKVKTQEDQTLVEEINKHTLNTEENDQHGGVVSMKNYKTWIQAGSSMFLILSLIFFLIGQGISQYTTVLVTAWTTDQYHWTGSTSLQPTCDKICPGNRCPNTTMGNICNAFLNTKADMQTIFQCAQPDSPPPNIDTSPKYLYLYIGCTIALFIFIYLGNALFTAFCLDAAQKLHNDMLYAIIRQPMQFFDTTPQGRIQNRFSKDTDAVDGNILRYMAQAIGIFFIIFTMVITMVAVSYPVLIILVPSIFIFSTIFMNFRRVAPYFKRIDAVSRSPVFSISSETVDLAATIRAFDAEIQYQDKFREAVETNIQANYLSIAIILWLKFRLGMLSATFAFSITLACILIAPYSAQMASYTGVIVSMSFTITFILQQLVVTMVQVESEMASVERLIEYSEKKPEQNKVRTKITTEQSPLKIKSLNFRYRSDLPLAISNLNLELKDNEHVGIVGRTGAGKSSIACAIFRLYEPENSTQIMLNGVNLMDLDLQQARSQLSIIPQEPFLFSGTLRSQLCRKTLCDSFDVQCQLDRIPDEKIWAVLDSVQIGNYFRSQPGGLESIIAPNGDNLSSGQKQLVCFARAMLTDTQCIILDEATAQVDRDTDQKIQETIRKQMANKQILCIAHRLETIIDFDKIIVMEGGEIVESGTSFELLQKDGLFSKMVENVGKEASQALKQIAIETQERRLIKK
ncbi:Xenobiotic-transporting ATPase / Multidrug resistance-associated protein [Spironucleus salmonicida]|uniref:Multidrug resistance-associated protein n=1 Tax=Spironucleus salmonicida TaxID=348837 RepID=V6LKW8_9EUKA|nr:Xenobiotic-transporting ATPase / Multidrug resistance-associated protein [Spironucleus salmonicida]|eukprot:EST41324.1 Multidrug resistance-associated protein [Spironucleus salmonicida]